MVELVYNLYGDLTVTVFLMYVKLRGGSRGGTQTAYIKDAVSQQHADRLTFAWQQQMPNKIMCSIASENKVGNTKRGGVKGGGADSLVMLLSCYNQQVSNPSRSPLNYPHTVMGVFSVSIHCILD
ncbi:MAG: hypothetical protein FRX49_00268 [Trebouxia sp. A1-2]|nr:MAG: hypothetical protein FRX49_00268 [Trebouxia sp. A1-2]